MGVLCSDNNNKRKEIVKLNKKHSIKSVKSNQDELFENNNNDNIKKKEKTDEKRNKSEDKFNQDISIPKKKKKSNDNNKERKISNKDKRKNNSNKNLIDIDEKEKEKEKSDKEPESSKQIKKKQKEDLRKSNLMKSYMPQLKIENNYYIVCPSCQLLFPTIKKFEYNSKEKDFNIFYTCKCNSSGKLSKSLFLNFINGNRPHERNENFNESKKFKELIKEADKKEDFQGKEILSNAIKNSLEINAAAPPASVNKSIRDSSIIKSYFPHFKVSKLQSIKEENEENKERNNNNKEVINSLPFNLQSEDNDNFKEYKCIKTFQKKARLSSLIQLDSGFLASGSYDCKICIWDLNQESDDVYEKELQEVGIVLCLMEFKPNYLLAGTNFNYISLWNLNSESNEPEFRFLGHEKWVNCLVKCNEEIFTSGSNDGYIITWNFEEKKLIIKIKAHDDCILCMTKLINGNICSGGVDLLIKIWNWQTGECLYKYEGFEHWIRCICQFDEQNLLVGSDNSVIIWKNKEINGYLSEHNHDVRDICVIDENYFASASFDNTIKIWNQNYLGCEQTLKGHTSNVINIIKLKGTTNLASCSVDNTIKIWSNN